MDANLRFQIPFTLLGRKDVLDPNTHSPIQIVHAALREFCPTIPIHFSPSPTSTLPETAWILHTPPTPPQSHLTLDEKAKLGRHVWSYPMVLQYNGITHFTSADAWTHFRSEAASIFDVLVRAFHDLRAPIGAKGVQGRMWSLVATESDLLRVSVVPGRMEDGRQGVFDGEVVRKMMMVFACVERELVQLCCPGVVLEYWMVSRFMELRGVRCLEEEKAELWRRLEGRTHLVGRKKEEVYKRDKEKWWSTLGDDEGGGERRNEWWNVIGECSVEDLLCDIWRFGESGRKLLVDPGFSKDDDEHHDSHPSIRSISFQPHRTTLDIKEIIAYLELLTNIIHLPLMTSHTNLLTWLERFCETTIRFPDQLLCGLDWMLRSLDIPHGTEYWQQWLNDGFSGIVNDTMHIQPCDLHVDPFRPIKEHIETLLAAERAYMTTFINRYSKAGGFYPTSRKKLYALMMADEHRRKKNDEKKVSK